MEVKPELLNAIGQFMGQRKVMYIPPVPKPIEQRPHRVTAHIPRDELEQIYLSELRKSPLTKRQLRELIPVGSSIRYHVINNLENRGIVTISGDRGENKLVTLN